MRNLFDRLSGLYGVAFTMLFSAFLFFPLFYGGDLKNKTLTQATSYIEGLRIIHRIKGETSWTMRAERADFTGNERIARMNSIVLDIKKEGMTLNAERGTFDLQTRYLKLEDNVVLRSKDYEITLKDLSWNPARSLVSSDQKIALRGNRFSIEGDGLSATEEQKLRLHRNVKAIFF